MISDYCRGDQEHSEKFLRYVSQRGYHLLTVKDYGLLLTKVGFSSVDAQDLTKPFIGILEKEMDSFKMSILSMKLHKRAKNKCTQKTANF